MVIFSLSRDNVLMDVKLMRLFVIDIYLLVRFEWGNEISG